VVRLLQEGLTNHEIARDLHLGEHTVGNDLFPIFDKLGVSIRVELALYLMNNSKEKPPVAESAHPSQAHWPALCERSRAASHPSTQFSVRCAESRDSSRRTVIHLRTTYAA